MPEMKTAASGVGARHSGSTRNISTRSLKHNRPTQATFIAVMDDGRFVGLRRFDDRVAARVAMRQGVMG